jgi:GTP-binding protein
VGLVGLPNAGKSTLLRRVSAATPKVADYPFTTLEPHLGIASAGDFRRIVFADIPGLIEGAHRGVGLGTEFLRHVERTKILVHLVSAESLSAERMEEHFRTIEKELAGYSPALASKPRIVVASKLDLVAPEERPRLVDAVAERIGAPVLPLSAVTGLGIRELLAALAPLALGTP